MSHQPTIISDSELLRQIGCGDVSCLCEFYRRHSRILFAAAFRILQNAADAEDVLQETFCQIWQKSAVFDATRGKPLSWALTLTRNKAIDRLRRVQRRNRLHDDIERQMQSWDRVSDRSSRDDAMAHEKQAIVRSAVIHLSPEQRRAIELAFFHGLTQNQIARKLHEPLGTIKARIRRGIVRLRKILNREF